MSRVITTILFCAITFLFSGLPQELHAQKDPIKTALKKAKEHIEYEEYQAAIPHLQDLLQTDARNPFFNYWMGKSLYKTYRKNQALPYLKIVEEVNPDIAPDFHLIYGLALHYNLNFDKAISEYTKDLERHEAGSKAHLETSNRISQCMYALNAIPSREATKVIVTNMGPKVNTEFSEHSPVLNKNNDLMAFTARRPSSKGSQPEAGYYDEDVYVSTKKNKEWSEAENVGSPINSKGHDATISISPEGKTMYVYRHDRNGGLYISKFDEAENSWGKLQSAGKPFNTRHYESSICVNRDSTMMFFTSDRTGGFGGLDIYRVRREGKDWGPPENVGPTINTPFNEDSPYFHEDDKTLYFSSDGPNGLGGYDIFVTEWDSAANNWLTPLNLGAPVNSTDDEIYFMLGNDDRKGFFASGKSGGFGEKDIYEVNFPHFPYPRRLHILELVGIVQDVNSLDTLQAWVRLRDAKTLAVMDSFPTGPKVGRYTFELEPKRAYSLEVVTQGYAAQEEIVEAPAIVDGDILIERNFYVGKTAAPKPLATPESMPEFQHIYFDFDKAELRPSAAKELDRIASFLQSHDGYSLQVLGHTDWFGSFAYNEELSTKRITAALDYLRELGMPEQKVRAAAFSENLPIEQNTSDEGRQYNRRCEFQVLDPEGRVVMASSKLISSGEPPLVDHTAPRGQPGFDNPNTMVSGDVPDAPASPAIALPATPKTDLSAAPLLPDAAAAGYESPDAPAEMKGLALSNIYFAYGKDQIQPQYRQELEKLLQLLRNDPSLELMIKGHTDSDGSNTFNQTLSDNRCSSVEAFFLQSGIDAARMVLNGHSEEHPIADNLSEQGRQWNRRVEFEVRKGNKVLLRSAP